MRPLTRTQKEIFDYISTFSGSNGHSPTFRDIQKQFRFASLGSVYAHVKTLKKKGLIQEGKHERIALNSHPIGLAQAEKNSYELTLIGQVAAGFPLETFPEPFTMEVPKMLVKNPDTSYLLKVKNDTLIEESLLEGDLIIIDTGAQATYGALIVATLAEGGALVKRYFPEDPWIRLENTSGRYEPLVVATDELEILGVITGVLRATLIQN